MATLKIKKGDTVKMLAGKDRGKTGKVIAVDYKTSKATVEGLNLRIKHKRPKKQGQKGQKVSIPSSTLLGKLMLICPHCGKATRVGHSVTEKDIKLRRCVKCNLTI